MLVTIVSALILLPQQVRSDPATPHVTAVVVARATILEAVRAGPAPLATDGKPEERHGPRKRPRQRPCPEAETTPCRLMVIDME
jgi:hypothetical protein